MFVLWIFVRVLGNGFCFGVVIWILIVCVDFKRDGVQDVRVPAALLAQPMAEAERATAAAAAFAAFRATAAAFWRGSSPKPQKLEPPSACLQL